MKPVSLIVVIMLLVIALVHLCRMVFHVEIIVAGDIVPMWVSAIVCVVTVALAELLWRERRA